LAEAAAEAWIWAAEEVAEVSSTSLITELPRAQNTPSLWVQEVTEHLLETEDIEPTGQVLNLTVTNLQSQQQTEEIQYSETL
jgi:hypothetical protein